MIKNTQQLTIEEDLFCTKYELAILSGIVNASMLERWVPGFCAFHTHKEHVSRYKWAKDFVENKSVLDIACGTGYGSYILAEEGKVTNLVACDIDEDTVRYASCRNRHPLINFYVQNAETLNFPSKFDLIISFETIEHLKKPEDFLANANKLLNSGGEFFVSTPISDLHLNNKPHNIYHNIEWGFENFQHLVSKYFEINSIYLQVNYTPPKLDTGLLSRFLRKFGVTKVNKEPSKEKLTPFKWDSGEISKELIGTIWKGYQILHCKKKTE